MATRAKKQRAKAGYMISAVAELYKLHPQTLRLYERVGLLKPSRSQGNTRLYTDEDLERLDVILTLPDTSTTDGWLWTPSGTRPPVLTREA